MSDLHADALGVLRHWHAPSAPQQALCDRYVAHLEAHADGMQRSCLPDHITVGALVVSPERDRVLLNLHRKAQRWFHFGGHCEPADLTLRSVAARELQEESGLTRFTLLPDPLQLSEHTVPFCSPTGPVQHLDVRYLALASPEDRHAASEESLDVRWWSLDELPSLGLDPELAALVESAAPAR